MIVTDILHKLSVEVLEDIQMQQLRFQSVTWHKIALH